MAVPSAVAYSTVTVFELAADSDTVKLAVVVPLLPSVTVTLLMVSEGMGSLSRMV